MQVLYYKVPLDNPSLGPTCFDQKFYEAKEHFAYTEPTVDPYEITDYSGPVPGPEFGDAIGTPEQFTDGLDWDTYEAGGYPPSGKHWYIPCPRDFEAHLTLTGAALVSFRPRASGFVLTGEWPARALLREYSYVARADLTLVGAAKPPVRPTYYGTSEADLLLAGEAGEIGHGARPVFTGASEVDLVVTGEAGEIGHGARPVFTGASEVDLVVTGEAIAEGPEEPTNPPMTFASVSNPHTIPDWPTAGVTVPVVVSGLVTGYVLTKCRIVITHTWIGDLSAQLTNGTAAAFCFQYGASFSPSFGACHGVNMDATYVPGSGTPVPCPGTGNPVTGTFTGAGDLGALSTVTNTTWNLVVTDNAGGDTGTVDLVELTFEHP